MVAVDTTNPVPSFQEPVVDRYRRWTPIWRKFFEPLWKTTRGNTRAINEVSGSVGDLEVTVTELSEVADSNADDIDGIFAQWGVTIDVNGHVVGLVRLDAGASGSTFTVVADKFIVSRPGVPGTTIQAFVVGAVNGVTTVGINGDLIVDGTILARHISVSTLSAIVADIGEVTAGIIRNAANTFVINLNTGTISIT